MIRPHRLIGQFLKFIIIFSLLSSVCAANDNQEPPSVGNFALPTSQQPGPLFGFGQNMLDKNETQLSIFADAFSGIKKHSIDVIPSILYGISDIFSIYINAPIAASFKDQNNHSAGWEDVFIQLEYAFYNKKNFRYSNQATIVANVTYPTGSIQKNPQTGAGAPSFFLGTTFNQTYVDWFIFGSPGVQLTTTANKSKLGNTYFYQFGFGKNILNKNDWLFAWMIEGDGAYSEQNRINGELNPNSGGNIIYITPSFWASSKTFIFQLGAGFPVTQNLFGNQGHNNYLLMTNFGWSFY